MKTLAILVWPSIVFVAYVFSQIVPSLTEKIQPVLSALGM